MQRSGHLHAQAALPLWKQPPVPIVYFFLFLGGGVRLSPLGTAVTNWPTVPSPDDRWWWMWSSWWNENWQGKPKYSEKICPSAKSHMTWLGMEPRAAAVGMYRGLCGPQSRCGYLLSSPRIEPRLSSPSLYRLSYPGSWDLRLLRKKKLVSSRPSTSLCPKCRSISMRLWYLKHTQNFVERCWFWFNLVHLKDFILSKGQDKNSVPKSQKHAVLSVTETNRLLLFREMIALYYENHIKTESHTVGKLLSPLI
jgi:hypothetical protein